MWHHLLHIMTQLQRIVEPETDHIPCSVQGCWKEEPDADPADPGIGTRVEERRAPAGQ